MQSLFGRRGFRRKSKDDTPPLPAKTSLVHPSATVPRNKAFTPYSRHNELPAVDEHGRPPPSQPSPSYLQPLPRSGTLPTAALDRSTSRETTATQNSSRLSAPDLGEVELQLCYGYWRIESDRELGLDAVDDIVRRCGDEIRLRGLDKPLLFSTHALDVDLDATCDLIRLYLSDYNVWCQDLQYANPHNLVAMIKWALGRIMNAQSSRGFLPWDMYERWRFGERDRAYNPRYITTHLIYHLPTQTANILTSLLQIMTSTAAYSSKNGSTPRSLAAVFSSFIFGLPDDKSFDSTYNCFIRFSHATEHLLLAYIRDQKESTGSIPTKLDEFISKYPHCLPSDLNRPSPAAVVKSVSRVKRTVRSYSKNLVRDACGWNVPNSLAWQLIYPDNSSSGRGILSESTKPAFTPSFRHLLNIRVSDNDSDEDDTMVKYKSVVEKEWFSFKEIGFSPPDEKKLMFDLKESERNQRRKRHATMDWTTFADMGFGGREMMNEDDLQFDQNISETISPTFDDRFENYKQNGKNEKSLPEFPFDTTPREEHPIYVDELFFEVWADVLVSSGWAKDEMKESCWALLNFKIRPTKDSRISPSTSADPRIEERWYLVEEVVPADYRDDPYEQKIKPSKANKRTSFLRSVRRKKKDNKQNGGFFDRMISEPSSATLPSSQSSPLSRNAYPTTISGPTNFRTLSGHNGVDNSVFEAGSRGQTTKLTLSRGNEFANGGRNPNYLAPISSRAPSAHTVNTQTTVNVQEDEYGPRSAPPDVTGNKEVLGRGIGGTISSQQPFKIPFIDRGPVGSSTKHPSSIASQSSSIASGFMATLKKKASRRANPDSSFAESDESAFEYGTRSVDSLTDPAAAGGRFGYGSAVPNDDDQEEAWVDVLVKSTTRTRINNQDYDPTRNTLSRSESSNHLAADARNGSGGLVSTPPPRGDSFSRDRDLPAPPTISTSASPSRNGKYKQAEDIENDDDFEPIDEEAVHRRNYRASRVTTATLGDAYDGFEEGDEDVPDMPDEGHAAWRGSKVYNGNYHDDSPASSNGAPPTPPSATGTVSSKAGSRLGTMNGRNGRYRDSDTLPPSPKPEADVPQDEERIRQYRLTAGSKMNDSKVGQLIEVYEGNDGRITSVHSHSSSENLRLSNFGFPSH